MDSRVVGDRGRKRKRGSDRRRRNEEVGKQERQRDRHGDTE